MGNNPCHPVTTHLLSHIILVKIKSLGPAVPKGRALHKEGKSQNPGVIEGINKFPKY